MKKYEVNVREYWLSVKHIKVIVKAKNEFQVRSKALAKANNSKDDDWSDTDTMEYTTEIDDIAEINKDTFQYDRI